MNPRHAATSLAAVLLLALATSPAALATGGTGAGTVSNDAPTVPTFSNSGGASPSRDTSDVFSGTVRDKNGESTIGLVAVEFTTAPGGVTPVRFERAVTASDRAATSEPGFDSNGWKVWNTGGSDGRLSFKFQYTWETAGSYVVRAIVRDADTTDHTGPAATLSITVTDGFTVAPDPVLADGTSHEEANWGAWTAIPGQRNVTSANFLKVTNTGTNATQRFVIDFTPTDFTGADGVASFPLNNNIRFACKEGTASQSPADLGFTADDLAAVATVGSVTVTFSAVDKVVFCMYNIDLVSDPLLDQEYSAGFTVS